MRTTNLNKTQKTAVVGGTVLALAVGGVAFAAWTSTGSGTGTATAGSATVLGVAGNQVTGLYPTVSVPATVTVTNPNPYDVKLASLTFTGATPDATHSTCNAASVTVASLTGLSDVITKSGGTVTKDVVVSMSNAAEDACQGATFTLAYTAAGASN